jgi:hypothetical protein
LEEGEVLFEVVGYDFGVWRIWVGGAGEAVVEDGDVEAGEAELDLGCGVVGGGRLRFGRADAADAEIALVEIAVLGWWLVVRRE